MSTSSRITEFGRRHRWARVGAVVIAVEALVAFAFLAYLLINDGMRAPWANTYEVEVVFEDAAGLDAEDEPRVSVAGVEVGKVTRVRSENGKAVVMLGIEQERARDLLRTDASAAIAPRSALNDLTVQVDPGDAQAALPDGRGIPAQRTQSDVRADELISVLDADTRAYLRVLLGQTQVALKGRSGELAGGLDRLGELTDSGRVVSAALAERRRLLTRLVNQSDTVLQALGDSGPELAEVVRAGRETLDVTAARNAEISSSFRQLPDALGSLSNALAEVERLSGPLDPALTRLRPFARRLPAGLDALDDFIPPARTLVRRLGPLTRDGVEPARELRRSLALAGPTSSGLRPTVRNVDRIARAIDENKYGVRDLGENFSGVFSTNDVNGPLLRGLGYFEAFRCENFGLSGELFPACGPPPAGAGSAAREDAEQLDNLRPAQLVLATLLQLCHGGPQAARNEAGCLVAYFSPETVKALPALTRTERGRNELALVKPALGRVLGDEGLDRLRDRLGNLLPANQIAQIVPATAAAVSGLLTSAQSVVMPAVAPKDVG